MKSALLGLCLGALVLLGACGSSPHMDAQLSAHSRPETADARFSATATTRRHHTSTTRRHTTTTRRHTSSTIPQPTMPTQPTTPTTFSQNGVAGVVLYDTNCAPDRPCQMEGGPAQLRLVTSKGVVVAEGNARSNGGFILQAPPGTYTLLAKPPAKRQSCDSQQVTVSAGQYTTTQVHCR